MGLRQAQETSKVSVLLAAWQLAGVIILVAGLLVLLGEEGQGLLRYDRAAIASGEFYRLFSGHVVHLGMPHLLLNLAGLMLVWLLVGTVFKTAEWVLVLVTSVAAIDLGFWFLLPGLDWYMGLSGVLHGFLLAGVLGLWRLRPTEAMLLALLIVIKLGYEMLVGPMPGSQATAGGEVITEAHLFGAIGGTLAGVLLSIRVRT